MNISKEVLSSLNTSFISSSREEETNLAHLLFICEELFGTSRISLRLFKTSKKIVSSVTETKII